MKEMDIEVLSEAGLDAQEHRMTAKRKSIIMGDSTEQSVAVFEPNAARSCVENPAVFKGGDNDA